MSTLILCISFLAYNISISDYKILQNTQITIAVTHA